MHIPDQNYDALNALEQIIKKCWTLQLLTKLSCTLVHKIIYSCIIKKQNYAALPMTGLSCSMLPITALNMALSMANLNTTIKTKTVVYAISLTKTNLHCILQSLNALNNATLNKNKKKLYCPTYNWTKLFGIIINCTPLYYDAIHPPPQKKEKICSTAHHRTKLYHTEHP